jgi:thiamine biosynthesis lipoprotein
MSLNPSLSRRRFLITAAACGLPLAASAAAPAPVEWSGLVLGGVGSIRLYHPDRQAARTLLARVADEARRLERIFSLYDPNSDLSRLNRAGILVDPAPELVDLLGDAAHVAALTGGAFDPTVQPLWTLYADHFSAEGHDPNGPSEAAVRAALGHVGLHHLHVSRDRIALDSGAALTLNGIAQGSITDRVVALLRQAGITSALVDMGEPCALGRAEGRPWRVGIADPRDGRGVARDVPLADRAAATSAAYGFAFVPGGRLNHLFDPKTGLSADPRRSLTVLAPDATTADGLSTALSLMDAEAIGRIVQGNPEVAVLVVDDEGAVTTFGTV